MRLKGFSNWKNGFKRTAIKSIRVDGKEIVKTQLEGSLKAQVDAFDNNFPEKKESTKKQYRSKGWDTENWLIRTGESTKLNFTNISNGFRVQANNPNKILHYVKMSGSWFTLNEHSKNEILRKLKEKLK